MLFNRHRLEVVVLVEDGRHPSYPRTGSKHSYARWGCLAVIRWRTSHNHRRRWFDLPGNPVQPSGTGSGVELIGGGQTIGSWPNANLWNFAHFTYSSTGTVVHYGTSSLNTLRGSAPPDYGTDKLLPAFIGGSAGDSKHNAGYNGYGGSTTGTSIIRIDCVGFSTSITNYTAKATNLFNSGSGRVCPAST